MLDALTAVMLEESASISELCARMESWAMAPHAAVIAAGPSSVWSYQTLFKSDRW